MIDRGSIPFGPAYELNNRPDWSEPSLAGILKSEGRTPRQGG
jgi:hypothetical protein